MWELDYKESWAPKNWCFWIVVLEKTLENLLDCKEIQPVHPKGNQSWIFIGRTDAEAQYFVHLLWRTDSFEKTLMLGKLKAGEGDDRGWDDWMASPTQWMWVWATSGSWWWTGKPGVLQSMGLQRVGHNWANELNWDNLKQMNTILWEQEGKQVSQLECWLLASELLLHQYYLHFIDRYIIRALGWSLERLIKFPRSYKERQYLWQIKTVFYIWVLLLRLWLLHAMCCLTMLITSPYWAKLN